MNIGLKWLGALALGSALSACYVVPVKQQYARGWHIHFGCTSGYKQHLASAFVSYQCHRRTHGRSTSHRYH